MELRTQAFKYFDKEIREFPELYLSKTADVNTQQLYQRTLSMIMRVNLMKMMKTWYLT